MELRLIKTGLTCLSFFIMGYLMSILGPTLLDLQLVVNASLQSTAFVVPTRALGYGFGSLVGGLTSKMAKLHTLLSLVLTMASVSLALAPWCHSMILLFTTVAVSGLFTGALDVFSTLYLLEIQKKRCATFIQLAYFFYGIGGFAAPALAARFLIPHNYKDLNVSNTTVTMIYNHDFIPIVYPYAFAAAFGPSVALLLFLVGKLSSNEEQTENEENDKNDAKKIHSVVSNIVILLTGIILHLYSGTVTATGSMLETFLVEGESHLSKTTAAYLTSAFWAGLSFFRLVTFVISEILGPSRTLTVELLIIVTSNLILLWLRQQYVMLWIGVVLLGVGYSSIFGLTLAFTQQYVQISPGVLSFFLILSCFGEFLYPCLVVTFVETHPHYFIFTLVGCSAFMCITFGILTVICKKLPRNL